MVTKLSRVNLWGRFIPDVVAESRFRAEIVARVLVARFFAEMFFELVWNILPLIGIRSWSFLVGAIRPF